MKIILVLVATVCGVFLSGCVAGTNGMVLDAVGPVPGPAEVSNSAKGLLVVYSAYEATAEFNARDPFCPNYTDYKILTADGKTWRRIHNNTGTALSGPACVELPAGEYRVVALVNGYGYGYVTIPVTVVARRETTLHLEGDGNWLNGSIFNPTNAVHLPDGRIIGYKNIQGS